MNFRSIPFLFLLIFGSGTLMSQSFNGGLIMGMNGAQITGDNMAGFNKGGILGGVFVDLPIKEKYIASFEILFTQKGSRRPISAENPNPPGTWNLLRISYLEVPLLLKYNIYEKLYISGALAAGLIVEKKFEDINAVGYKGNEIDWLKNTEFSYHIGLDYLIHEKILLFTRYNSSLHSIATGSSNSVFSRYNRGYINVVASIGIRFYPASF
jgi:hypothetical protein